MFNKILNHLFLASSFFAIKGESQGAIIIDSFTNGAFTLHNPQNRSDYNPDPGYAFQTRSAEGSNTRSWTATLNPTTGSFTYTAQLLFAPTNSDFFHLGYLAQGASLNLLGYDAFVFSVSSLTGSGALQMSINGNPNGSINTSNPLYNFTGTGNIVVPFAEAFPGGTWSNNVISMQFQLVPLSRDFSITLEEIAIIPEPEITGFLSLAVWIGLGRRIRHDPFSRFRAYRGN